VATYAGVGIYATKILALTDGAPPKIALSVEGNTVSTEPFTQIGTESGRLGVIRRVSHLVAGLDTRLTEIEERIGSYEINIADAALELEQPFTHAAELARLRARQATLLQELSEEATDEHNDTTASSPESSTSNEVRPDDDEDEAVWLHVDSAPPPPRHQEDASAWSY